MAATAAVKVTDWPTLTVWLAGLDVTTGKILQVSVPGFESVVPALLVKTARYRLPVWSASVENV